VPILIETLARLKFETPAIHALIVGDTGDTYATEAQVSLDRAGALGVADRFHLVGRVNGDELLDAYRSADLFVMPSVHEGFCIPVIEAMACGLPVIAARAAALPETVAGGGLTFQPDDAEDLARQVRRVLGEDRESKIEDRGSRIESKRTNCQSEFVVDDVHGSPISFPRSSILDPQLRIAVVAFRFGNDFVGGAESSLRIAALALRDQGHQVEVFTTCTTSEGNWSNTLRSGSTTCDEMNLHRFPIDPHDRPRHLESFSRVMQAEDGIPLELENEYLRHSIHSTALIEELRRRLAQFDAVIVGPYLHGLTWEVAREFSEKTIVVPCIHDEPIARFRAWPKVYGAAGGIWYHSEEEKDFAEAELGLNHPGGVCIGTWLDTETSGIPNRGRKLVGGDRPYLLYAGRYSEYKNLPILLEFAQKYHEKYPDRFTNVFLGEGHIKIPTAPWVRDLGYVEETDKRDVMAGASALLQLSRSESLSLVALEAWLQETPVLADRRCAVLAGHLDRCGGGRAVDSYESYAEVLDDLWKNPDAWKARGQQGRNYVRENYGSRAAYTRRLEASIRNLKRPLAERMRRRGLERAALFSRAVWREQMATAVEDILDSTHRPRQEFVEVTPRTKSMNVAAGQDSVLVPVRLMNRGTHAVLAEGPGRLLIRSQVSGETEALTLLPDLLMPGQKMPATVTISVPRQIGNYQISFQVVRDPEVEAAFQTVAPSFCLLDSSTMDLIVENRLVSTSEGWSGSLQELFRMALAEASRCQQLPDDYTDVTEGLFAKWKRWIKGKLLGNFKHAYVDVLSRRQSRFNQQILTALTELADYCATLEHAVRAKHEIRNPESETNSNLEAPMVASSNLPSLDM
jgi:glycosyltransferase involved in cell wall biosynthesis